MKDLFSDTDKELEPAGFFYVPDFISAEEEERLLKIIEGIELHTLLFRGYEAKRKVKSLGYHYNFDSRSISEGDPIPHEFDFLIKRVAKHLNIRPKEIGQMLITEYPPGSVINWHRDAPPFDIIIGISLLSDCKFRLRPYKKELQNRSSIKNFIVQRGSLYVMKDEARENWEHSIDKVKETRYSITLRTLRTKEITGKI